MKVSEDRYSKSILSNPDHINVWLVTPSGYYLDTDEFGFDAHAILFKNTQESKNRLSRVYDKLVTDVGWTFATQVREMGVIREDADVIRLGVIYEGKISTSNKINNTRI